MVLFPVYIIKQSIVMKKGKNPLSARQYTYTYICMHLYIDIHVHIQQTLPPCPGKKKEKTDILRMSSKWER